MAGKKNKKQKNNKPNNSKNSNSWEDHLTRKAKAQNYPARSIYKLEEIQNKFKVIKQNDRVLDLGCAPGSWLLYAAKQIGKNGMIYGIDLKKIDIQMPDNVFTAQTDILNLHDNFFWNETDKFSVVLSDMAPATTGRKDVDALRSFELCNMALKIADKFLAVNGNFICKIFQGNNFSSFQKNVKSGFRICKVFKPESCRKQSKEIYIIAKGKKAGI